VPGANKGMFNPQKPLSSTEFVALAAITTSIVALATDAMLPALPQIGRDLAVVDPNEPQLVVSMLFLGFSAGQLIVGPLSDCFGRKPVILGGYAVFIAGCILSFMATDLTTMLIGRVLQGVGAAAPRIVMMSLVRDLYEGRAMARILSIVMSVFILVPAVAPSIGQGILMFAQWPDIFIVLLAMAVLGAGWLALRQPETLSPENKRTLSIGNILAGYAAVLRNRTAVGYSVTASLTFGAFLSYLSSAQQVFQDALGVGEMFPIYFGMAALAIGAASIVNARLVMRFGMRRLTRLGFIGMTGLSGLFLVYLFAMNPTPGIIEFMIWQLPTFFFIGLQFGNLNALAMEPLGHLAGLGAAVVGGVSTIIAVPVGWFIAHLFNGSIEPLISGFCVLGFVALFVIHWTDKKPPEMVTVSS